ncbi:protein mahjong [Anopheles stephensi]|uniref:protein mahjong n=1 Tax=Anopheles stephensi TaxID=30069 RepID=UPI001658B8FB|nr:protein mahjong [Anopheles stephensi]XP_035893895.1 protein mahjong [Anopheles stephensi]
MAALDQAEVLSGNDLSRILQLWDEKHSVAGYDPEPIVTRLAELFEAEIVAYKMKDPDPFDERHPSRTDPNCELGRMLKLLFRRDQFITRLVNDYLRDNFYMRQNIHQSSHALNVAACRLILVIMPGLDTSAVFQVEYDHLIKRLYGWAENSAEPLQSYATGLLGAAMEEQEIAVSFREQNIRLLPIMLARLHSLQQQALGQRPPVVTQPEPSTSRLRSMPEIPPLSPQEPNGDEQLTDGTMMMDDADGQTAASNERPAQEEDAMEVGGGGGGEAEPSARTPTTAGTIMIPYYPVTLATSQMLILNYLTPMGEYQEFLPHVFEHNAMQLIFRYIEHLDPKDTCLAFEALKYLASLLCHKKFSLEFIANGGLERLLKIPRPSLAATGVSIAFYYLAYCEDAMERICQMPREIITEMVSYALWLLGCSHDSGRCHATMFFGLSCQFKIILDEFDNQDGIRQLYNVIAVLPVLVVSDDYQMNEDEEASERQVIRHVCVALKKYFENHLYYKYIQVTRQQEPQSAGTLTQPVFKAVKNSPEVISQQITTLQELLPMKAHWAPVDELLKLGGVTLLLRIILLTFDWTYSGRGDTVRYALDALSVCTVISRVHSVFVEPLHHHDGILTGISILLSAVDGDVADAEVQKSALALLVHLVCAPVHRPSGSLARYGSAKKRMPNKSSEELIQKVWESVRSNNGILVLLALMRIKVPITDADCIRGMACRALAGLARSETVRQIVGKLPLFVHGELQSLMRDPILQEKRVEHVQFQKYALELMERVSGKVDSFGSQVDTSLSDIHKANVVAQTRIQFNEQQVYQLIYQHLVANGLKDTAATLVKESGLSSTMFQQLPHHHHSLQNPSSSISRSAAALHSPFVFRSPNTNIIQRSRIRSRTVDASFNASTAQANLQAALAAASIESTNNGSAAATATVPTGGGVNGFGAATPEGSFDGMAGGGGSSSPTIDPGEPLAPIKLIKKQTSTSGSASTGTQNGHHPTASRVAATPADMNRSTTSSTSQRSLQKQISATDASNFLLLATTTAKTTLPTELVPPAPNNITLNSIITEYLTNQHALCKHPMSTCPPFDLFKPHKCPDPRPNRVSGVGNNFAARFYRRQAGFASRRFDRRLVHSNFSASRVLRTAEVDYCFTSCDFTPCGTRLLVGSLSGEVKIFNLNDTNEEHSFSCHETTVSSIKCSKDGKFLITSAIWRYPISALWSLDGNQILEKLVWDDEDYVEFANLTPERVLATTNQIASIYDITTGQKVMKFEPAIANHYTKNRATFCPNDELILSDGVLWDVTSGKEIHKFDKLNQNISGVFHPNGLEIVENTEVWDLRTFHLLRTVPSLDQTHVKFSSQSVMYGITLDKEDSEVAEVAAYQTSFKVLDSYDYSSIATIDVKRNISDLAVNRYGSQIAVVENQGGYNSLQESVVRIYSVGRKRNIGDDQDEDEEELENSEENTLSETESVGSSASNTDEDGEDDDDNDDDDEDGDGDNNNDGGDGDDEDDDPDAGGGDDSDDSSWTTASDVEDYLFSYR